MATYNDSPHEVLGNGLSAYVAALATSMPVVDAAPSGSFTLLGNSGQLNMGDSGVEINLKQTNKPWTPLGSTVATKVFRVTEEITVKFTLMDVRAEMISYALNGNTVTTVAASAGVAGYKSVNLMRGLLVNPLALLLRGASGHGDFVGQFELYRAVHVGEPQLVFQKGEPVGLDFTFNCLRDASLGVGVWKQQTAAAS